MASTLSTDPTLPGEDVSLDSSASQSITLPTDKLAAVITQFLLDVLPNSIAKAIVSIVSLVVWIIGIVYLVQLIDRSYIPMYISNTSIWIMGGQIPLQVWIIVSCLLAPIVSVSWAQLTNYIGILAGLLIATLFFRRMRGRWILLIIAILTILTNIIALFFDSSSTLWLQYITEWSSTVVILLALIDMLVWGPI